ncbi:hypothetical protein LSTR_LSTR005398 [Laodelphax striatellus]|uniref:Adenomatous polyposis coli protein n=1 Tax=Laodelphax striatellus TaxID=195883 RepID=A0A482WQW1_LAOST|nr:hypothetical protein LSTR_LSTR005398 [Laodelphax striatellus]
MILNKLNKEIPCIPNTDKPSAKPDLVQPKTTEEKPIDYSSKLKDDQVDEKKSTSLERRKSSQREVCDEKSAKSNSSTGQHSSHATEDDHLIAEEDMPTDYSLKYHEGGDNKTREELDERYQKQADYNLMVRYRSCKSPEGVSAEAELDQPTDYSLKYRESSASEGEKRNSMDNRHDIIENSGHYAETDLDEALEYYTEDKVQTYCTEGTPYAFSNATSMSDLRVSEVNDTPAEKITTAEPALDQPTDYSFKYRENSECEGEKETASVGCHDNETSGHYAETDLDEALDYYTEDKVQTYCTEGTPYAFSNATSMSDLRVTETNEQTPEKLPKEDSVEGIKKASSPVGTPANGCQTAEPVIAEVPPTEENRENKGATLETPLMFSRSSSLGSLSNCEPPDGSVGCEFSRFTSGVVSPYDLPDSPLQTGPSSPRNIKPSPQQPAGKVVTFETPLMFSRCSSLGSLSSVEPPDSSVVSEFSRFASGVISPFELPDSPTQTGPPSPRNVKPLPPLPAVGKGVIPANVHPSSVFEDTVASFKEESTPQHFSTGTSLSSLTFDDEPTPLQQQMIKHQQQRINNTSNSSSSAGPNSTSSSSSPSATGIETGASKDVDAVLAPVSEEEDEDDMLAACINIGMQNSNRQRSSHISKPAPLSRLPKPRHSGIPIKAAAGVNVTPTGHHQPNFNQRKLHNPQHQLIMDSEVNEDSTTEFCTEGTPANISHATSHSDLSMLCASSDDDHDNNMVAECIRSAMPQARNSKSAVKIEPLSSSNKQANEKQKEIIDTRVKFQTPKSSPQQQTVHAPITYNSPRVKDIKGIAAQDEMECFAVEGSPGVFSTRSSLSDLTINSVPKSRDRCPVSPAPDDGLSPLSSLEPEVTVLSRQLSAGSLSGADVDVDGDWTEEQALLEQCISSGMPPPQPTKNGHRPAVAPLVTTVVAPGTTGATSHAHPPRPHTNVAIIANMDMESSYLSDLDSVRPPSAMGSLLSLTQSISEADTRGGSRKMPQSMRGLVARRALANDSSLSWNNIDSIKPPSGMDELLDLENSILSVASITSEIADFPNSLSEDVTLAEASDTNLDLPQSPQPQKRITPKQKRQNVKDRYNTYTINSDHLQNGGVGGMPTEAVTSSTVYDEQEQSDDVMASSPKLQRLTPKQRRQADKERFMTRTLGVEEQQQLNNLSPMPSLEMQAEVTSTQPPSPPTTPRESVDSDDMLSGEEEELEVEKAKPRVVKPSAGTAQSLAEAKAIRGRKKVRSGIPISAKVSPVPSPAPATLAKDKKAVPPPTPPVLQRQGTFTKDEPTTPPPSGIPVLSKKASPIRTVKKKSTGTPQANGGAGSGSKTPAVRNLVGRGRAGSLPRTEPVKKPALGVRSSISNQSLKSEALGSDSSLNSSPNSASSTPRWSSNSNLTAKKDATSKIASLWKKVEDSKRKDTVGKDTRVWIAAPSKQAA